MQPYKSRDGGSRSATITTTTAKNTRKCKTSLIGCSSTDISHGLRCLNVKLWRWPLVPVTLFILVLSHSVSSLPTLPVSISNELPDTQPAINANNQSSLFNNNNDDETGNNETSSTIEREFAAGIATSEGLNLTEEFQEQHDTKRVDFLRERNRQQRIVSIQKTILEKLGLFQTPNITNPPHVSDDYRRRMERVFHLLQSQPQNVQSTEPEDIYAKRVQSFYPSCSLPRNMDRDLWGDANLFHIYYEIPVPQLVEGTSMTVSSARLRLYKIASMTDNSVTSPLSVTNSPTTLRGTDVNPVSCDERIRITVFQYTRPLKKTKKNIKRKRKLIDSRMVAEDFEGWLEFDVRSSARDWLENSSRNLGLEIELEDSLATTRNPSEYLRNMNCSEANDPPFPRFMEDRMKNPMGDDDATSLFENETYPTLDLKTIEIEDPVDVVPKSNKASGNTSRQPNVARSLQKRHVITKSCGGNYPQDEVDESGETTNCCKKNTYVSFSDFEGGDRILEPLGFYTKVCVGLCLPKKGEEYTCAPKTKSGVEVTVLDDNDNKVKVVLPDVVTKSCSCQPKSSIQQQDEY